jgi:hypothetical protein
MRPCLLRAAEKHSCIPSQRQLQPLDYIYMDPFSPSGTHKARPSLSACCPTVSQRTTHVSNSAPSDSAGTSGGRPEPPSTAMLQLCLGYDREFFFSRHFRALNDCGRFIFFVRRVFV